MRRDGCCVAAQARKDTRAWWWWLLASWRCRSAMIRAIVHRDVITKAPDQPNVSCVDGLSNSAHCSDLAGEVATSEDPGAEGTASKNRRDDHHRDGLPSARPRPSATHADHARTPAWQHRIRMTSQRVAPSERAPRCARAECAKTSREIADDGQDHMASTRRIALTPWDRRSR